jgi:hypothetical protein
MPSSAKVENIWSCPQLSTLIELCVSTLKTLRVNILPRYPRMFPKILEPLRSSGRHKIDMQQVPFGGQDSSEVFYVTDSVLSGAFLLDARIFVYKKKKLQSLC